MNFINLKELIPKDKFDLEPFQRLAKLREDEIQPILRELFQWTADMHWPIMDNVVDILVRFPDSVIPLVKELLEPIETDEDWKNSVIVKLIPMFPVNVQRKYLLDDIKRIMLTPTDSEIYGGVQDFAENYMESYYGSEVMEKVLPIWRGKSTLDKE